jgi:hypothetical protein
MKNRSGTDIAWAAVIGLCVFLVVWAIGIAVIAYFNPEDDPTLSPNAQVVLVAGIGAVASIAGTTIGLRHGRKEGDDDDS